MGDIKLVVYGTNSHDIYEMEAATKTFQQNLSFFCGNARDATKANELDALLITLMQAERFGISPPFPLNESVVVATRTNDIAKGLPRFLVAGVRIDPGSPRNWTTEVGVFLKAGIRAIQRHNASCIDTIQRVGVLIDNFQPAKVGMPQIAKAMIETMSV